MTRFLFRFASSVSLAYLLCVLFPLAGQAAPPSRTQTYTAGAIIEPAEVTENEDNIFSYLQAGVDTYKAGSVNSAAIADGTITNTDIASGTITAAELAADSVDASEIAADAVGASEISTDAVGTAELDDDANTPTAGAIVVVETGAASFDYITQNAGTDVTADLEEETHASEHQDTGADEIAVTGGMMSADFGDFTCDGTATGCTLDSGTVDASELAATLTMADGDFLNFSASNASSTTDGIRLPQNTSCTAATAEGQVCWDSDGDTLYVGSGSAASAVGRSVLVLGTTHALSSDFYCANSACSATETSVDQVLLPIAASVANLYCSVDTAPGSGKTYDAFIRDDLGSTAVTCQIADTNTTCSDTSNSAAVAAGSRITIFWDATSAPAAPVASVCAFTVQ